MAGQREISSRELLVINETKSEQRNTVTRLRVVEWIVGDKDKRYRRCELREFYYGDDGDLKTGKAKGFGVEDMEILKKNWAAVMRALGSMLPEYVAAENSSQPEPESTTDF